MLVPCLRVEEDATKEGWKKEVRSAEEEALKKSWKKEELKKRLQKLFVADYSAAEYQLTSTGSGESTETKRLGFQGCRGTDVLTTFSYYRVFFL